VKQHHQGFLETDLHKYFHRYSVEKFVQRYLRQNGLNSVDDMLALDRTDFEEYFSEANQTIRKRSLDLYQALRQHEKRILERAQQSSPTPSVLKEEKQSGLLFEKHGGLLFEQSTPEQNIQIGSSTQSSDSKKHNQQHTYTTTDDDSGTISDLSPLRIGYAIKKNGFGEETRSGVRTLPVDEEGLRRHILIAGATGSGKTVAARFIIEQAAIHGIPSIVVDAQGDISSLVLQDPVADEETLFKKAAALQNPTTERERHDLRDKIKLHLDALRKHPGPLIRHYADRCVPRIFTPGRPDLGLGLALPPFVDVLGSYSESSGAETLEFELTELLQEEVQNLVRHLFSTRRHDVEQDYSELLLKIFKHAHSENISLDGKVGIEHLLDIAAEAQELWPDFIDKQLSRSDYDKFFKALRRQKYEKNAKWQEGSSLDIRELIQPRIDGKTPINIINVQELHDPEEKKRVLRQLVAAVYKFGVQNPRQTGKPSLIFYVDEIGSGYGERSVAKPDAQTAYQVYPILLRLVRQSRKYGISVILASQAYTDFYTDLRKQLGTKIIGKVDERAEQKRVMDSIRGDLSEIGKDPVAIELLPSLAPPRLLYIDKRGEAEFYDQLKCCSLDLVLRAEALRQWRIQFRDTCQNTIDGSREQLSRGNYQAALDTLEKAESDVRFFGSIQQSSQALRAKCFTKLSQFREASELYLGCDEAEQSDEWLEVAQDLAKCLDQQALLSQEQGRSLEAQSLLEECDKILTRAVQIASRHDRPLAREEFEAWLSKHRLFKIGNPELAKKVLVRLSQSEQENTRLFGDIWRRVIETFTDWTSAWPFFSRSLEDPITLVEKGGDPSKVQVRRLPREEAKVEEPFSYTPQLVENSAILRLGYTIKPLSPKFEDLKSIYASQESQSLILRELRHKGRTDQAVKEISQYFSSFLIALTSIPPSPLRAVAQAL